MLIPHAHHVLWFLATFLLLWSVSLILRGLGRGRSKPLDKKEAITGVSRWAISAGVVLLALGTGAFPLGLWVRRWSTSDSAPASFASGMFEAASVGMLVFAVTISFVGLFRDSARGRRRCPKCWYDMASLASSGRFVCPECGTDAKSERKLKRTRRRWTPSLIGAVLALVATVLPGVPNVERDGPKALVPTTVMIAGMWYWPDSWFWSRDGSLSSRLEQDRAWGWQRDWAAERALTKLVFASTTAEYMRAKAVLRICDAEEEELASTSMAQLGTRLASADPQHRAVAAEIADAWMRGGLFHEPFSQEVVRHITDSADEIVPALTCPEPRVVVCAASILSQAGCYSDAVVEAILRAYPDVGGDSIERRTAILLRAKPGAKEVVDAILGKLGSPYPSVRRMVIHQLQSVEQTTVVPAPVLNRLESLANADPDSYTASNAADALVELRSREPNARAVLIEFVRSRGALRRPAFEKLVWRGDIPKLDPEVVALVDAGLRGNDAVMIYSALRGIAWRARARDKEMIRYRDDAQRLNGHADDDVRQQAEYARRAIEELGRE